MLTSQMKFAMNGMIKWNHLIYLTGKINNERSVSMAPIFIIAIALSCGVAIVIGGGYLIAQIVTFSFSRQV